MKQIKTVVNRLDNSADFDNEVNAALKDGYKLTRREVINPNAQNNSRFTYIMLYAELEKEDGQGGGVCFVPIK